VNILVVEDDPVNQIVISKLLKSLHHHTSAITSSYKEAIAVVGKLKDLDLALVDIDLVGDHSGIELAKVLKEKHNLPFIYITSHIDESTYNEAIATGPDNYIVKPFNQNQIKVALDFFEKNIEIKEKEKKISLSNQYKGGKDLVSVSAISYVESKGRYTIVHTLDGKSYQEIGSFEKMLEQIGDQVIKVHRSFAVNKDKITGIKNNEVLIATNISVPVSRSRMKEVKHLFDLS
jgi:DNA-binding LytR/AlgR family response regulator